MMPPARHDVWDLIRDGCTSPEVESVTCHAFQTQFFSSSGADGRMCKPGLQELSWLAGYDEDSNSKKRSLFSIATEAVLLALHRPMAV